MTTLVKICGLRDREAVAAAAAAGADAIGFVFAESVRRVTVEEANEAAANLPGNVLRVAVMLRPSRDEWAAIWRSFSPDVLQTDLADFARLNIPDEVQRWPVIREGAAAAAAVPETFVYEGGRSGHGQRVDWQQAAKLARRGKMILAGGLNAENVATAIATVGPYGVDASSGLESAPGRKDLAKIEAFIRAAKNPVKEAEQ